MKKMMMLMAMVLLIVSLAACQGGGSNSSSGGSNSGANEVGKSSRGSVGDQSVSSDSGMSDQARESAASAEKPNSNSKPATDRMVIYNAHMTVTVAKFQEARNDIQSLVSDAGGYIVQSSVHRTENNMQSGNMTARIPQPKFQAFLAQVEKVADTVKERSINGRDVTRQYIDLQSRLKAKVAVQQRLNQFLKKAKDSDALLDISNQLANVQEEIEQIKGEMKYLENHSAMATVSISLLETDNGLKQQEDLDTWGKTKQAFVDSINTLLAFASGLFIFIIGYSPILIILLVIVVIGYIVYRRQKRKDG